MNSQNWLIEQIGDLTDEIITVSPSEWAEANRRLPDGSPLPGPYDYDVTPYLREVVDCLDDRSPVRELVIMKGAQTGGTVGVAENAIGYWIAHIKTAPVMFVTATLDLAKLRMDEYITPMIEQSGLSHLIQNNTENKRKAGQTARKMSWLGGGWSVFLSANEAAGLRSASISKLVLDELDSYPLRVGRDGDPVGLAKTRTKAYARNKKILMISTPTTAEQSRIAQEYKAGDQRVYKMPCLGCGVFEELRWSWTDRDGKQTGGMVWDLDERGNVKPGSVRYACPSCGFCHMNEHKRKMLPLGRWEATADPSHPSIRSYHISGLMSPPDFYSWEEAVLDWLKAWNVETKKPRDHEKLQEFYNNVLGQTYRIGGSKLTMAKVGRHARDFDFGVVPNGIAVDMCGGKISFLTCAADIHKNFISAAVYAWGPGRVGFLVANHTFTGPTDDPFAKSGPWAELSDLIDSKYSDGIDREYHIQMTLIDSSWLTSEVLRFCEQYESGVFPIQGNANPQKGPTREFKRISDASQTGVDGWHIYVNHYKNRLSSVLHAKPRPDTELAVGDSVSFPVEIADKTLKEMTAEERVEKKLPNGRTQMEWKRTGRNELWDLTVYNMAARDILGFTICREHFELPTVEWPQFWDYADEIRLGWAEITPVAEK